MIAPGSADYMKLMLKTDNPNAVQKYQPSSGFGNNGTFWTMENTDFVYGPVQWKTLS